jgi:hypothetical protein
MKASKFIVLVGGILGLLAFFLPLVTVDRGSAKASVSAFQIIKGLDQVEVAVTDAGARREIDVATSASAKQDLGALKGIVMAIFAPALLLTLLGGIGAARKRFGRVAGASSLLLGLAGLGIGAVLKSAAGGDGGIGLTLLLLTGVAGVLGGLIALVKPQRAAAALAPLAEVVTPPRARLAA